MRLKQRLPWPNSDRLRAAAQYVAMGQKPKSGRQVPRGPFVAVTGQSATLTKKGAEAFEANIAEHRDHDENRDMLAGMKHKIGKPVNEPMEG